MLKLEQNLGLSGEFRVIVRRADGSTKLDTGMQPNLVLDNALKYLIGERELVDSSNSSVTLRPYGYNGLLYACVVGEGNAAPSTTDIKLQEAVSYNSTTGEVDKGIEYPEPGKHEGFVKAWRSKRFIFNNLENRNITEVGLMLQVESGTPSTSNYVLATRALIKDDRGSPFVVTVLAGEVLEIVYRINFYVDIKRSTGTFKLTTTHGRNKVENVFDYFLQPYDVSYIGDGVLSFTDSYGVITSWGVKEEDTEVSADYNFDEYQGITYRSIYGVNGISSKTGGYKTSRISPRDSQENELSVNIGTNIDASNKRVSSTYESNVNSHVHPNGIRAFNFFVMSGGSSQLVYGLVVVKNRANGQGIKKTDRQKWEFTVSFSVSRWNG